MTARKFRNTWWIDFRHEHQRYRRRSPENSKAGAQAYEAVLRHRLARGETLDFAERQTFKNFALGWFDTYVKNNNKYSEIKSKEYVLRGHLIPFFGETPIDKINAWQVEQYKSKKMSAGLAHKTVNNHLIVLGKCMRDAQEWIGLTKIPKIKKLKLPLLKNDFLSVPESELLLANSYGVWREIILTALKTGLRLGELRH
ncbi:hypothetical protein KGQ34_00265 [Patescibacteria group bacterium]|nr:hypothetical protein [Patescibacteria group bacterium]